MGRQADGGSNPVVTVPPRDMGQRARLWRLATGAGLAALLFAAVAAQGAPRAADDTAASTAKTTAPGKTATKKAEPGKNASKKAAAEIAAKKAAPGKTAAATDVRSPPAQKRADRPHEAKTALAAAKSGPTDRHAAAEAKPGLPSYTITTTRGHVTYTTTRIVRLVPASPAPPTVKLAAAPATAPSQAKPAPLRPAKSAAAPTPAKPIAAPAPPIKAAAVPAVKPAVMPQPAPAAAPARPQIAALPAAPPKAQNTSQATPPAGHTAEAAPGATPAPAKLVAPVSLTSPSPPPARSAAPPAAPPLPADPATASRFIENFLHEAFRLARAGGATPLQRRAQLADLFAHTLDVVRIAGYTTADELAAMPAAMQQRFRTILISYLVETYYPRIELASDPSIEVATVPAASLTDGTAIVSTTFTKSGWGSESVKWQLMPTSEGYRIVDIFSAGASLIQMERDTFRSVMRSGGVPELMAKLDARTKELASAAP